MQTAKGNISISTENIFPIIKKWLYSEKDIFVRELVSNGNDAIVKMRKLAGMGEAQVADDEVYKIIVTVDKDNKTISIEDNGLGMTAEEVAKYINQIAFSGAKEFLEKYKDKAEDAQIIGHFGLGFYSAFMVSTKVRIDTMSWQPGAEAVAWESDGQGEYAMEPSDRAARGTKVTLFVADDAAEYLDRWKLRETLVKYFRFLPYELYLIDAADERKKAAEKKDEAKSEGGEASPKPINDVNPLWNKAAKDCTDEEYKKFYREVFSDYAEPLFWVHLNIDYPFQLKGILYFPRLKNEFDTIEGQVKLYCNQVFVADNIKEVIPEYLLLLKGCIDCPDLPLNVSRSFLQNDGTVKKLSQHITKKVGDKLMSLFETERETYCKYWDSINPFIKFGCLRDEKFYDRVKDGVIFKTINGDYRTVQEYLDEFAKAEEAQEPDWEAEDNEGSEADKPRMKTVHRKTVYYVSDVKQQAQYVQMFKAHGLNAVQLNTMIDNHFITFLEMKLKDTRFKRIDSDLSDAVKGADSAIAKEDIDTIAAIIKTFNESIKTTMEHLKESGAPAIVLLSEESRRMQEMSKLYGGGMGMDMPSFPADETLVLNADHGLVKKLVALAREEEKKDDAELLAAQLHDLAMLSHRPLEPEALAKFVERSAKVLERLN